MTTPEIRMIGENLRQFMTDNNITFRQAAARSGLAISTISELINGQDKKISYYFILASAIGMPIKTALSTENSTQDSQLLHLLNQIPTNQKTILKNLLDTLI